MSTRYAGPLAVAITVMLAGCSSLPPAISAPTPPVALRPSAALVGAAPERLPPLAIDAMRQRDYPGSDLVIERTLAPGSNYRQYVAVTPAQMTATLILGSITSARSVMLPPIECPHIPIRLGSAFP